MDERDRRARSIQETISKILYEDWDPLRLTGIAPSDEYDSYVGGVYRLLVSGASANDIAEHLAQIERGPMGDDEATAARTMHVAEKLCQLDVRLEGEV